MDSDDAIYLINKLVGYSKNNDFSYIELDKKELDEIIRVITELLKEIENNKFSEFNMSRINKWSELTNILNNADDNTICPICHDQIIGCDCVTDLAQDILESISIIKWVLP